MGAARHKRRAGFTIAEVLMAMLVLLAGITAAVKLFPAGLSAGRRAAESTSAAIVGQAALDYIQALGYNEDDAEFRFADTDGVYYSYLLRWPVHDWDNMSQRYFDPPSGDPMTDWINEFFIDRNNAWVTPDTPLEQRFAAGVVCYGQGEEKGASVTIELVDGGMHIPVRYQHKVTVSVPLDVEVMPVSGTITDPSESQGQRWAVEDSDLSTRFGSEAEGNNELLGKMLVMKSGDARGMAFLITEYKSGGKIVLRWEHQDVRDLIAIGDKYRISDRRDFITYVGRM